ncbi:MFS transporter [Catenibacillus scindens]|uniref:MFS transporter n=1 Tax=Catenibacillus scindens TaxID=673271 RepID=UPI003208E123
MSEQKIPEKRRKEKLFTANFTFLILGQASSLLGNNTLKFALSMYVLEQTGSASVFAGLLSLAMLPTIFLSPFGGILADRVNRRNIMVALDALSGGTVLIASFAMALEHKIFVVGVLLMLLSVFGAFESPTVQACIPQMLSGENIVKGNAVVNQVASIASLVTPFLGSVFYTVFGIRPVFYAAVLCFFMTAFFECFIHLNAQKADSKSEMGAAIRDDFLMSLHFLRREQPEILKLLLLAAAVSLFVAGTAVVGFPYLVRTVLGLSAAHYGAAESVMGLASVLGSILVVALGSKGQMRGLFGVIVLLGVCLITCGAAFLLPLSSFWRYGILLGMFAVCQLGASLFSTYAISLIQERTPEKLMGKIMSYVFTISMCAQPAGQIIYGALFDRFSDRVFWVLIPSGLIVTGIGMASARFFRSLSAVKYDKDNNGVL